MFNPIDVINFFELLNEFDFVSIEENQNEEDVTLDNIKAFNRGNNCLHYILVHDNHRIVIQTYKNLRRKGKIDVVQGKPEFDSHFMHMLEIMNARPQDYTDDRLNKLFVLYCGMWQKCSSFYWRIDNGFTCEFSPNIVISWVKEANWIIDLVKVKSRHVKFVNNFINAIEDICDE